MLEAFSAPLMGKMFTYMGLDQKGLLCGGILITLDVT